MSYLRNLESDLREGTYLAAANTPDQRAQLLAALERARVVGVLDAWAKSKCGRWQIRSNLLGNAFSCDLAWKQANRAPRLRSDFCGQTPEAARAAAARAIESGAI